jgi:hypothetical protein
LGVELGLRDQGPMAAVYAVKIADRHHGATKGRRHVVEMAEDAQT